MADNTDSVVTKRHRPSRDGKVASRSGRKTVVVEVTRRVQHPLYKRYVNQTRHFHVHDEQEQCQVGDWVRIVETRPLSRLKRWRLQQILRRGAGELVRQAQEETQS